MTEIIYEDPAIVLAQNKGLTQRTTLLLLILFFYKSLLYAGPIIFYHYGIQERANVKWSKEQGWKY